MAWHFEDLPLEAAVDWRPSVFWGGGGSLALFGFLDAGVCLWWFF